MNIKTVFIHFLLKSNKGVRFLYLFDNEKAFPHQELSCSFQVGQLHLAFFSSDHEPDVIVKVPDDLKGFDFSQDSEEIVIWTSDEIIIGDLFFQPLHQIFLKPVETFKDLKDEEARSALTYLLERTSSKSSYDKTDLHETLEDGASCFSDDSSR